MPPAGSVYRPDISTMAPVALITDFGTSSWYSGALKGSILTVGEAIPIIDITHEIPPGDSAAAAFTLATVADSFPETTVFCTVVDPGVRGSRRSLAAIVNKRYLVGPDNGVLSWMIGKHSDATIVTIENTEVLGLEPGKCEEMLLRHDLFGMTAGYLATGGSLASLGTPVTSYQVLPFPQTTVTTTRIQTVVLSIDRFGNLITAAESSLITRTVSCAIRHIAIGTELFPCTCATAYSDVSRGELLVYKGSSGYIEIAVSSGNAAKHLTALIGSAITLILK